MAVLLQELVVPETSFVLHTGGIDRSPATQQQEGLQSSEVYAELAPGLGEVLASAKMRGSAYRMLIDRETGKARWCLCMAKLRLFRRGVLSRARIRCFGRRALRLPSSKPNLLRRASFLQALTSCCRLAAFQTSLCPLFLAAKAL